MTLLLVHFTLLALASHAAARRLAGVALNRLLAAALLGWANIVATSLGLSTLQKLGDPSWFFRGSLLLALATWLVLRRLRPEPAAGPVGADRPSGLLLVACLGTLGLLAWVGLRLAVTYEPNNYDTLAYHLPRAMYYLGQGDLAHFDTGNPRQIYFPFNYNLLQLACLIYGAPDQVVNFPNLIAWAVAGVALYRIGRLSALGANASLVAAWFALTATQVLGQGTATTNDLPTGAGLLCALVFALEWRQSRRTEDALLAGLAAGLAAGSKLTVIFFVPAGGLLLLAFAWRHWRAGELRVFFQGVRAWIAPGLLAFAFASPFALINLAEKGEWINKTYDFTLNRPFSAGCAVQTAEAYLAQMFLEPLHRFTFDLNFTERLNAWGRHTLFPNWNPAYAFSPLYLFPPDLNEDHVWFGFTGPLLLLAGLFCLARSRREQAPAAWLAWIGLGWFATYFLLNKWSLYNQRYFVPAILVLAPCLGAAIEAGWRHPAARTTVRNLLLALAACSLWLAGIYLFHNTSRPFAPLWAGQTPPAALPALPPLLAQRLADQTRVNVDSQDGNERIFLLMTQRPGQRFTSSATPQPAAYNIFSQWGFVRKVAYSNIEQLSSYTTVEIPTKRTAGVEFLGTIGTGQPSLDYYGLVPHPETQPATPANRHVFVILYYAPREPNRYSQLRIKIAGLNKPDQARLHVGVDYSDGTSERLASFDANGEARASVTRPFRKFTVRVEDRADQREIGAVDLPYFTRDDPTETAAAYIPGAVFSTELVSLSPEGRVTTSGLAGAEGPYPQWDLPLIRWAKAPVVRMEIPADNHLHLIKLSFDLRLHVRDGAQFDVLHNGVVVGDYAWNTATGWFIRELSLPARPGVNVIEFRNVTVGTEPDWFDYLARYPDVKAYVVAQGVPLEQGAREHYEAFGRKENRVLYRQRHVTPIGGESLYYMFRRLRVDGFRVP